MSNPELCARCGGPKTAGTCPRCAGESNRVVRRDILLLALLFTIAVALFIFTRSMAAKERQLDTDVGAFWFNQGQQQVRSGEMEKAVESFRKATNRVHDNRVYVLALANALAAAHHTDEARQALLRLRESAPENGEINLYLARLEAKRGDVVEAVRYYHNALYGLWTGSQIDEELRNVRVELINFLIDHQQHSAALSEVLILGASIPEGDAAGQIEAGQLFLKAGDPEHALRHFVRALALNRNDAAALEGAGNAAFQLGDYARANRYLDGALAQGSGSDSTRQLLDISRMILSNDPLASHLRTAERNRRVMVDFDQALRRLQTCLSQRTGGKDNASLALQALETDALAMQSKLKPGNLHRDPEMLGSAMELISKIEETTNTSCGEPSGLDRALLLIGRKHQGALQ